MASQLEVDLIVKAISAGFDKVSKDLKTVGGASEDASKQTEKAGMSFQEMSFQLQNAQQAAQIFFGTFQQAFELGRAGEVVRQTSASFDTLTSAVGVSSGLLDQLRAASRGTVDDMTLMSATSTLLAGTQGELATALAMATPQLMEMAKAAQKLNPSLGDTTFLYESLALGIKRASPMILDNLGITVRVGDANAEYAKQLGKTVDALTAEEQKVALLNAVLKQGDTLIQQAGGNTIAYTDSIDRMNASLKNAADAMKAQLAPAISQAADSVYYMLNGQNLIVSALDQQSQKTAISAASWSWYVQEMDRAAKAAGLFVTETGGQLRVMQDTSQGAVDLTSKFNILSQAQFDEIRAAAGVTGATVTLNGGLSALGETITDTAQATEDAAYATQDYAAYLGGFEEALANTPHQMELMSEIQDQLAITSAGLAAGLAGDLQSAITDYSETMTELVSSASELNVQLEEATQKYGANSEQVAELTAKLQENEAEQLKAAEALRVATAEMIYQQASAGLDTQASLDLARAMGLLSESDYVAATSLEALRQLYDANRDGAISAGEGASSFAKDVALMYEAISNLQKANTNITFENIAAEMERLRQSTADGEASTELQEIGDQAKGVEEVASAADDSAGATSDAASGSDAFNAALKRAAPTISSVTGDIQDIADAMKDIPKTSNIRFTSTGGEEVKTLLQEILDGIAALPATKTVSIKVKAEEAGGTTESSLLSGGGGGGAGITITNNIYDQGAAALAMNQQNALIRSKAEGLM